ncbi:MAG: tryptophan--tRNA ligase [Candidatus Cloacimonetes bacterium]|nr:tryptophan--tRNA ligase [Candidatus Cloacimonadota bacterium]
MKRALTGIKPTGIPHIGNYFGAIKPGLELAENYQAFYFIADYHALNQIKDSKQLKDSSYQVAAAWLACGLDPKKTLIYRQSSVPETFELSTILAAFTPKGLMNRAHAYKAVVAQNEEAGKNTDDGVNMGLFTYPILMAADILLFDADVVPVGKDQKQHLEMAIDIAQTINYTYQKELLKIPEPVIRTETETVIGLDGRKMSKSYNNVIPLFLPAGQLRKHVMRIVTNSQTVEESKDPETCNIFALYKLFASKHEQEALAKMYRDGGMGWGVAKQTLFEKMDIELTPYRNHYDELMSDKAQIDKILDEGSALARSIAVRKMAKLRKALGVG